MDDTEKELSQPFSLASKFVDELIENHMSRSDIAGALAYAVSDVAHRTANTLVLYSVVSGMIDGCIEDQTTHESPEKFAPRILPEGVEELRPDEVLFELTDADYELLADMEEQYGISKEIHSAVDLETSVGQGVVELTMTKPFEPKLEILPESQRELWPELNEVPESFTLYDGTALALRLGHRQSVDFDFFGSEAFDPDELLGSVPFLSDAEVTKKSANNLTAKVNRGKDVSVSFFGMPEFKRLRDGDTVADNGITIASIYDLAGTKAAVVQKRAEAKDYIDIDAMLQANAIDLPQALTAGRMIYGKQFNPEVTLKALCYFDDGSLRKLPEATRQRLVAAVQKVDLSNLPLLGQSSPGRDQGMSR